MVLGTCGNSFPSRQIYEAFTWSSELQQLSPFIREKVVPPDPPAELSSPPPPLEANSSFLCERLVEFFKQISKESV